MEKKRRVPISVTDFKQIIENNYAYVDKTLFVQELLEKGADVSIIPRPRRFGKTINMSMLKYFFEKSDQDHAHLFAGTNIWKIPEYRALQGNYPVIFLTLKGGKDASNWQEAFENIKFIIGEEFRRHKYLLNSNCLDPDEKENFQEVINRTASDTIYLFSLKSLSKYLKSYFKKNVIILIDEYDSPIINAYLRNFYEQMLLFMRGWLGEGLKDNSNLERGVITGILRIAKEDLFSSLNNPKTYTILEETFADKFGFLEKELSILLNEYGLLNELESMRKWYNGYCLGPYTVYNPWSIMNCIDSNGALRPYWVNTGGRDILNRLVMNGSEYLKSEIEDVLSGHSVTKPIEEGTSLKSLDKDGESAWNILLFSGYLTLAEPPKYEKGTTYCKLKIPNYEIDCLYQQIIKEWFYTTIKQEGTNLLLKTLLFGDVDNFSTLFNKFIMETISYYDLSENEPEKIYHALILGILIFLRDTHEVKSNRESGYGRYDVLIIPKEKKDLGIVMEFKTVNPKQDLEEGAANALEQIEKRHYAQELRQRGIAQVMGLGLAFQGKQVVIKHKMLS